MTGNLAEEDLWELAGYVKGGEHRDEVFRYLAQNGPAIPSKVAEETNRRPQRVYDAQSELEKRELIELKVPDEQKKGRLRALTETGKQVWTFMVDEGMVG